MFNTRFCDLSAPTERLVMAAIESELADPKNKFIYRILHRTLGSVCIEYWDPRTERSEQIRFCTHGELWNMTPQQLYDQLREWCKKL